MLRNAKTLERFEICASDGLVGHLADFYFDDQFWRVRYLIVDTGSWLSSRQVLISPVAVTGSEWDANILSVELTKEQVRKSPGIDTAKPVERQQEKALFEYYGWPYYWGDAGPPGAPMTGTAVAAGARFPADETEIGMRSEEKARAERAAAQADPHLRSVRDVTGYHLEAGDGGIGHVEDFLLDDQSWDIRYLVIDTRNWWPGKKVLVAPQWITHVSWAESKVFTDLTRDTIKNSPAYDPSKPVTPDYAGRLHEHYGRPHDVW